MQLCGTVVFSACRPQTPHQAATKEYLRPQPKTSIFACALSVAKEEDVLRIPDTTQPSRKTPTPAANAIFLRGDGYCAKPSASKGVSAITYQRYEIKLSQAQVTLLRRRRAEPSRRYRPSGHPLCRCSRGHLTNRA